MHSKKRIIAKTKKKVISTVSSIEKVERANEICLPKAKTSSNSPKRMKIPNTGNKEKPAPIRKSPLKNSETSRTSTKLPKMRIGGLVHHKKEKIIKSVPVGKQSKAVLEKSIGVMKGEEEKQIVNIESSKEISIEGRNEDPMDVDSFRIENRAKININKESYQIMEPGQQGNGEIKSPDKKSTLDVPKPSHIRRSTMALPCAVADEFKQALENNQLKYRKSMTAYSDNTFTEIVREKLTEIQTKRSIELPKIKSLWSIADNNIKKATSMVTDSKHKIKCSLALSDRSSFTEEWDGKSISSQSGNTPKYYPAKEILPSILPVIQIIKQKETFGEKEEKKMISNSLSSESIQSNSEEENINEKRSESEEDLYEDDGWAQRQSTAGFGKILEPATPFPMSQFGPKSLAKLPRKSATRFDALEGGDWQFDRQNKMDAFRAEKEAIMNNEMAQREEREERIKKQLNTITHKMGEIDQKEKRDEFKKQKTEKLELSGKMTDYDSKMSKYLAKIENIFELTKQTQRDVEKTHDILTGIQQNESFNRNMLSSGSFAGQFIDDEILFAGGHDPLSTLEPAGPDNQSHHSQGVAALGLKTTQDAEISQLSNILHEKGFTSEDLIGGITSTELMEELAEMKNKLIFYEEKIMQSETRRLESETRMIQRDKENATLKRLINELEIRIRGPPIEKCGGPIPADQSTHRNSVGVWIYIYIYILYIDYIYL